MKEGKFIVFEGIDGSGKTTQIDHLLQHLRENDIPYHQTKEPTDSPIGSVIHQILTGRVKTDKKVLAPLFVADRMDHLYNEVDGLVQMIKDGVTVVADRYYFSSYAYQGLDISVEEVMEMNRMFPRILKPTINIFIDVPIQTAAARISKRSQRGELFDDIFYLEAIRNNYMKAFDLHKKKEVIEIIDGDRPEQEIADDIWKLVAPTLLNVLS